MDLLERAINWRPNSKTLKLEVNLPWEVGSDDDGRSETVRCLWPFFRYYRILGMCPVSRDGNNVSVRKKLHPTWYFTWFFMTVMIVLWINYVIKSFPIEKGTTKLVDTANNLIYYTHILFTCIYMIIKAEEIPRFVNSCILVEEVCRSYEEGERKTTSLMRDSYFLLLFFNFTHLTGNVLYYYSSVSQNNATSFSEFFVLVNNEFYFAYGNGNSFSGAAYFFSLTYCDMGWTTGDALLAVLSLMLARLFSRFNKVLSRQTNLSSGKIEKLRSDHQQICELVQVCNNIFSPLFFLTYVGNVAYLFTRLYTGLGKDLNNGAVVVQVEAVYAFAFLVFIKILLPTYLAGRLSEKAHEGLSVIHAWDSSVGAYDFNPKLLVIARFVSQMSTAEIGISGCGYFNITKGFLVTLISAFITYEVVILQFQAAELASQE